MKTETEIRTALEDYKKHKELNIDFIELLKWVLE